MTHPPPGLVHCHGGYLSGILETMAFVFGIEHLGHLGEDKPKTGRGAKAEAKQKLGREEVMFVVGTPGWITGQSYMIMGSLAAGITGVLMEGSPVAPDSLRFAKIIQRHAVTIFKAGGCMYFMIHTPGLLFQLAVFAAWTTWGPYLTIHGRLLDQGPPFCVKSWHIPSRSHASPRRISRLCVWLASARSPWRPHCKLSP